MLIKRSHLKKFLPSLSWSDEELADKLSSIGHEAEVVRDDTLEVKIFPNRGDTLSLYGLSRDLSAHFTELGELAEPEIAPLPKPADFIKLNITDKAKAFITADELLKIDNYQHTESPPEIKAYLATLGLQPKDLLIDITNALTYELGLPLHVFDYGKISSGLEVDLSRSGEEVMLLDGKNYKLPKDLLIQRHNNEVVDLMGVMGGKNSAVSEKTTNVVFQATTFGGAIIRRNSREAKVHTEASYRNQRGVDPKLASVSLSRVAYLLTKYVPRVKISGYQPYKAVAVRTIIEVLPEQISRVLGVSVSQKNLENLNRLGFSYDKPELTVPSWRQDVTIVADVAEEVAKMIGLNELGDKPLTNQAPAKSGEYENVLDIKRLLAKYGLSETMSYSFTSEGSLKLQNPRNKAQTAMRPTLKYGLLQTLARNPYLSKSMLYECGHVFKPEEENYLGIITSGYKDSAVQELNQKLSSVLGTELRFEEVSQTDRDECDVKQSRVYFAELPIPTVNGTTDEVLPIEKLPKYRPISKFPPAVRDVTLVMDSSIQPSTIVKKLGGEGKVFVVEHIDTYTSDEKLGSDKAALTFRLIFQSLERTLTDEEANKIQEEIFHNLETTVKFEIR